LGWRETADALGEVTELDGDWRTEKLKVVDEQSSLPPLVGLFVKNNIHYIPKQFNPVI
jgi:hypothetical protein